MTRMTRMTRRDFNALAAASLLAPRAFAQASEGPTLARAIPNTGERLPAVGLGTASVFDSDNESTRAAAAQVMRTLVDAGGRLIDTASTYGGAESVLGNVIAAAGSRDKIFIATKVEEPSDAEFKRSLTRLKTTKVDLLQLHNVNDPRQSLAQFRAWKAQGLCRYIGITSTYRSAFPAVEAVLEQEKPDFVQIDYSLDDREAEKRILPPRGRGQGRCADCAALRSRPPVPRRWRQGNSRLGEGFRRQLGAVFPEISDCRRTRHRGHSGHLQPGAHGGQSGRHA